MSITQSPEVRSVLRVLRADPEFDELVQQRVWSPQHLTAIAATYGLFALGAWLSLSGLGPWFVSIPISAAGIYIGFTTLHDSTHRSVSTSPFLNDLMGSVSGFLLLPGIRTSVYRILHVEHHRWVGDKKRDPDYWLVATPRLLLPMVLMLPEVLWLQWYIRNEWSTRSTRHRIDFATVMGVYFAMVFGFLLSPVASTFIVVYLIPQKLAMLVTAYVFAHIQHPEDADWQDSPFSSTVRMNSGAFNLNRILWLGQADHCIHHFFPQIPFDKYRHGWALANGILEKQGIPERGLVRPSSDVIVRVPEGPATLRVTVTGRQALTDSVDLFKLSPLLGPLPTFDAGAHIRVSLPSGKVRSYSLCGSRKDPFYSIAVKREPEGRGGSREVHESLTLGATADIYPPQNHFALDGAGEVTLIAGGIGITPLLAMADVLHSRGTSFQLVACGRSESEMPFATQFSQFPFADAFVSRPDDSDGRSTLEPTTDIGAWSDGRELYLCGPQGFMDFVAEAAAELGWPDQAIRTESFGVVPGGFEDDTAFTLTLARSQRSVQVAVGQQMIDALTEAHVVVNWSCGQGVCGTCVTPVVSGTPLHRDAVLTEAERASNELICLCVSRAVGDELVIDL